MATAKAQTLQQRFGFQDNELSTPKHDEIMLWLDAWLDENFCKFLSWSHVEVYGWKEKTFPSATVPEPMIFKDAPMWSWKEVHSVKERNPPVSYMPKYDITMAESEELDCIKIKDKGDLDFVIPDFPLVIPLTKVWESPIVDRSYTIGFADMKVWYSMPKLCFHRNLNTIQVVTDTQFVRDERTAYFEVKPSIPSLGEVIRQIRMYQTYTQGKWFVVSPDSRFKQQLIAQGIGFIEAVL